MKLVRSALVLAAVVSLGLAGTQAVLAETTAHGGFAGSPSASHDPAPSPEVVWKSESFKSVVKDIDGGGTQRCLLWLRKPYRPVGGDTVFAKAKVTCNVGRIGLSGRGNFSISQGPGCGQESTGMYFTPKWKFRAGRWVYPLTLKCPDQPGIDQYTDSIAVWDERHPSDDYRAELAHTGLA